MQHLLVSGLRLLSRTCARRKKRAAKRGGGQHSIPIDDKRAEEQLSVDPPDPAAGPDVEFERAWARTLFGRVRDLLTKSYRKAGRSVLVEALIPWLDDDGEDPPYRELSRELGMSVGSLRVSVFRLRQRYRSLLKQEIADTLADPKELESETGHLVLLFQK